jgi:hypothetical protein
MAPYVTEIVQGETLFLELAVRDETGNPVSVIGTTLSIVTSDPIVDAQVVGLIGEPATNSIKIRGDGSDTTNWPPGQFTLQAWLNWGGAADVEDEIIFEAQVAVRRKS